MPTLDELRAAFDQAESEAIALSNEYDAKRFALRDEYEPRLREANVRHVTAQKAYADAEAAHGLVGDPDAERIAAELGLTLPDL